MILTNNIRHLFSVFDIGYMRQEFQHKICYKKKRAFLNLKNTPTKSLSTRLMKTGKFLKIYKLLRMYYLHFIIKNNCFHVPLASNFLFFYQRYQSFKDFDRVLL